jgi:hypothetical protein
MTYRIELLFVGDAPDGEMERAKILADVDVTAAVRNLSSNLEKAGFAHIVTARSVRATSRATKPSLRSVEAAE